METFVIFFCCLNFHLYIDQVVRCIVNKIRKSVDSRIITDFITHTIPRSDWDCSNTQENLILYSNFHNNRSFKKTLFTTNKKTVTSNHTKIAMVIVYVHLFPKQPKKKLFYLGKFRSYKILCCN